MSSIPVETPNPISKQELLFIEKAGHYYEDVYRVPHIAGRILGLLLISPHPYSMQDIARSLKISHGSASTNLRHLVELGLIERQFIDGKRSAGFRFFPRTRVMVIREHVNHFQELKQIIETGRSQLTLSQDINQRLDEMVAWSDLAIKKYAEFTGEWEEYIKRR